MSQKMQGVSIFDSMIESIIQNSDFLDGEFASSPSYILILNHFWRLKNDDPA
jgi:hypothetical protein